MNIARCILISAALLATPAVSGAEAGVGRGDMEFFADAATFLLDGGDLRTELYLRIPNAGLRFKQVDGRLQNKSQLSIKIVDADGKVVVDEGGDIGFDASSEEEATSPLYFQTLIKKYDLAPGNYEVSVALVDLYSPKLTVVGMVRGQHNTALLGKHPLVVPEFSDDHITISDAMFLWDTDSDAAVFYHPNPSRLYGLYRDSLSVYLEVYVPSGIDGLDHIGLNSIIVDEQGETVREAEIDFSPESGESVPGSHRTFPVVITEDLNLFLAGNYTLYVGATRESGEELAKVRMGTFDVAWDMRTWEMSRRDFLAEARFLLGDKEFDEFKTKSVGEQEVLLRAMWAEHDPDPETGVNEAYEVFLERLDFVNQRYSDYQLGIYTDRGLVYMRYGPPDETVVDVMPLNRETTSDALEKLRDRYHAVNFSNTGGRMGYAQPSRDIVIDPRRMGTVGEGGNTAYPFELWIYNGTGRPVLKRDMSIEQDLGLRFIFVDREGFGRYKLESSSSMTPK